MDRGQTLDALTGAIDRAFRETGATRAEVAGRCGVSLSAVSAWRSGQNFPTISQILDMDDAFGYEQGGLLLRAGLVNIPLSAILAESPAFDEEAANLLLEYYITLVHEVARRRAIGTLDAYPQPPDPSTGALADALLPAVASLASAIARVATDAVTGDYSVLTASGGGR